MTISPTAAFAAMNEAVHGEGGKVLQRKFKGSVVFKIIDTGDIYTLDLKSSDPSVKEGSIDDADLIVECESENMAKLITGELKPQQAFMKGKLKIKGKMNLAMKLTSVLVATRKKLPVSKM